MSDFYQLISMINDVLIGMVVVNMNLVGCLGGSYVILAAFNFDRQTLVRLIRHRTDLSMNASFLHSLSEGSDSLDECSSTENATFIVQ